MDEQPSCKYGVHKNNRPIIICMRSHSVLIDVTYNLPIVAILFASTSCLKDNCRKYAHMQLVVYSIVVFYPGSYRTPIYIIAKHLQLAHVLYHRRTACLLTGPPPPSKPKLSTYKVNQVFNKYL